jgi:hypothetical protein
MHARAPTQYAIGLLLAAGLLVTGWLADALIWLSCADAGSQTGICAGASDGTGRRILVFLAPALVVLATLSLRPRLLLAFSGALLAAQAAYVVLVELLI